MTMSKVLAKEEKCYLRDGSFQYVSKRWFITDKQTDFIDLFVNKRRYFAK